MNSWKIWLCLGLVLLSTLGCRTKVVTKAEHADNPISDSAIHNLIEQLASPSPLEFPSGEWDRLTTQRTMQNGFIHPQVESARQKLIRKGSAIYPQLAGAIRDQRYSYSLIAAAWVNCSVGTAVRQIMAEGVELPQGYKWRANPTGGNPPPSFEEMVTELGGIEKYAETATGRPKELLRQEFINWRIGKERSYGFVDAEQERLCTQVLVQSNRGN